MSMVARDILAVPAAGVGCERVFSVAGALYDHRKNFHPDTFSAMMMVRFYDQKENADASLHVDFVRTGNRCQIPKLADKAICIYLGKEWPVAVANLHGVRNRIGRNSR